MAKKLNPFAADFEGLDKSADDKVFAMLKSAEKRSEVAPKPPVMAKAAKPTSATTFEKTGTEKPKVKSVQSEENKKPKPKSAVEWGKPVAYFNTRIPEQMAELVDDLIYSLRKKGQRKTKQDLAQEALLDLLRKHSVC